MSESEPAKAKHTPQDWDEIRLSFSTSMMVDTKLVSLSQNLEITEWPLDGISETPSKYIDYTYEELMELPGIAEMPERIDLLIDILKETMEFDDPFGDMVATVDAATKKEDNIGSNLEKIGVPKDFPIKFTNLSDDTNRFVPQRTLTILGSLQRFRKTWQKTSFWGATSKNCSMRLIIWMKMLLPNFFHLDQNITACIFLKQLDTYWAT